MTKTDIQSLSDNFIFEFFCICNYLIFLALIFENLIYRTASSLLLRADFVFNFGYSDFDIVSDFGFRYSNFHDVCSTLVSMSNCQNQVQNFWDIVLVKRGCLRKYSIPKDQLLTTWIPSSSPTQACLSENISTKEFGRKRDVQSGQTYLFL